MMYNLCAKPNPIVHHTVTVPNIAIFTGGTQSIASHGRCMALGLPALPYGAVAPAAEKSSRNLMDIYSYMYINILCIYLDKIYHVHTCEVAFGSFSKRIR